MFFWLSSPPYYLRSNPIPLSVCILPMFSVRVANILADIFRDTKKRETKIEVGFGDSYVHNEMILTLGKRVANELSSNKPCGLFSGLNSGIFNCQALSTGSVDSGSVSISLILIVNKSESRVICKQNLTLRLFEIISTS